MRFQKLSSPQRGVGTGIQRFLQKHNLEDYATKAKALGFNRFLVNGAYQTKVLVVFDFHGFGAALQPNLRCAEAFFFKLTPMVRFHEV